MLDLMNPGTTPQKVTMGGLSAVVDIDTWETAGNINCSYQRGITYNVAATPKCRSRSDILGPKETLDNLVFFVANSLSHSRWF
jgi:hypothetical protein